MESSVWGVGGLIIAPPQLYKNLLVTFDNNSPPLKEFRGKQCHYSHS